MLLNQSAACIDEALQLQLYKAVNTTRNGSSKETRSISYLRYLCYLGRLSLAQRWCHGPLPSKPIQAKPSQASQDSQASQARNALHRIEICARSALKGNKCVWTETRHTTQSHQHSRDAVAAMWADVLSLLPGSCSCKYATGIQASSSWSSSPSWSNATATASALRRLIYHTAMYVYVWCMCVRAWVCVCVCVVVIPPLPPKTHSNVVYGVSTVGYDLNSSCRRRLSQKGTKCD